MTNEQFELFNSVLNRIAESLRKSADCHEYQKELDKQAQDAYMAALAQQQKGGNHAKESPVAH